MKNSAEPAEVLAPAEAATPIASESVNPKPARGAAGGRAKVRQAEAADRFPVVALCGSAGALEALEQFFAALPPLSGLAFVVVLHRLPDPEDGTQLTQVMQHFTALPVLEAADGLRVRPNHVYVIPPDYDLSLLHGTLFLLSPMQPACRRQPIDFFLQTLAKDAGERAVCVILSGMGSDGTVGLKLVMESFGMVMVQDPATATCDAMPRAALATEFVDFVLPPAQMPAQLLAYVERPLDVRPARDPAASSPSQPSHALQKIFLLIRTQTGHDFSFYKRNTVFRRIERRMNAHQIQEFTHYVRYLQENPQEVEQLFHELLIGVTKFFRDAEAFASLKAHLRPLLAAKPTDGTVRVWAPGCSTGEEAYSLAMTLFECLDELEPNRHHLKVQIFATDISAEGIASARTGLYADNIVADVSPERLARFFQKTDDHYQIRKEVRDVVVFALHNINKDAPFIKLDLVVCRNLLIYLSGELQKSLLPVFHYALNPNGLLFLGPSENITGYQDLFQPLDVKWKISRRTAIAASLPHLIKFPFAMACHPTAAPPTTALMSPSGINHRQNGTARYSASLADCVSEPLLALTTELRVYSANRAFAEAFQETAADLPGQSLATLGHGAWNQPALHQYLRTLLDPATPNSELDNLEFEADFPRLGQRVRLYGRRLLHQGHSTGQLLLGVRAVEEVE